MPHYDYYSKGFWVVCVFRFQDTIEYYDECFGRLGDIPRISVRLLYRGGSQGYGTQLVSILLAQVIILNHVANTPVLQKYWEYCWWMSQYDWCWLILSDQNFGWVDLEYPPQYQCDQNQGRAAHRFSPRISWST